MSTAPSIRRSWIGDEQDTGCSVLTPRGVLNRNLGRGVQPTQRNPYPVQDTKHVNFATLSKRKCCTFLPCSRLDQAGRIQNTKNGTYKFVFSRISTKAHEISKNCDRRGRKEEDLKERPCLRHENVKLYTLFKTEDPENDTLTVGTSLYREYMGVPPQGSDRLATASILQWDIL